MISYPSMNFGDKTVSDVKISSYLISAFAEDSEDNSDDGSEDKTSDKTNSDTKDNIDDKNKDKTNHETEDKIDDKNNYNTSDNTNNENEDSTDDKNKDNTDDNTKDETKNNSNETEIEVEVKSDKAIVKIYLNGDQYRFIVNDTSESAIIATIMDKTGLTEEQIRADWNFHTEDHSKEPSGKNDIARENTTKHENDAKKTADNTVLQLQQKIDQLEQRLQDLLNKFESGKYFGTVTNADSTPNSYAASFTGTATSLDDASIVSDVDGNIYLESITTGSDSFKLRVTGGDILIGDTFYDFVFGKARLASSDGTTSVIVLGQIMDDQGNVSTVRLTLNTATPITSDLSQPVSFTIDSARSKIAKQWSLDATGNFGLV
ncbi:MAG: hypothetical protein K8Q89_07610 [Nitrosarchaeum sp.]|nr:hypothetical protein [Nitrosarchaeum sp.]